MDSKPSLFIKKLSPNAKLPAKGSDRAAGYDIFSAEDNVVPAKGKALIKSGISIAVPPGNYGRVAPRSGLAWKNFIDTGAGVIDEDYRGEVGVILFNHSDKDFEVKVGDRVAQLIIEKITDTQIAEVSELDDTNRGSGGFGSTGVHGEVNHQPNGDNLKRKMPEGGFLGRDILAKGNSLTGEEDFQWREWSILILYSLCEAGSITYTEKKAWGKLIFDGDKKAFEILKEYSQVGDITLLKKKFDNLMI